MYPKNHAIAGFLLCLVLWLLNFIGIQGIHFTLTALIIIWLSNLLIDVDHYFIYVWRKHDWSILRAYNFGKNVIVKEMKRPPKNYYLCVFHTIEFLLLLFVTTIITRYPFLVYINIGFSFHIATDLVAASAEHRIHKSTLTLFSLIARAVKRIKEKRKKKREQKREKGRGKRKM